MDSFVRRFGVTVLLGWNLLYQSPVTGLAAGELVIEAKQNFHQSGLVDCFGEDRRDGYAVCAWFGCFRGPVEIHHGDPRD